jgi:hypothetical protein
MPKIKEFYRFFTMSLLIPFSELQQFCLLDFFTTDLHGITLKQGIHKMVLSVLFRGNSFFLYLLHALRYALCLFFRLPSGRRPLRAGGRVPTSNFRPLSPGFHSLTPET